MLVLLLRTVLPVVLATLGIENWFFKDDDMPRYNEFRIMELVLSGGNPVIIGFVQDDNPTDDNRLFTMREYELVNNVWSRVWYFNYDGGQWDDDGYAITQYRTDDTPPEVRFLGVGFHQVDLPIAAQSTAESGHVVLLDDDGDTVCATYTFREDWSDVCCRDVVYIGDLDHDEEVYATCGWYKDNEDPPITHGFVEIAYGNTKVERIEDSGIDGTWEEIIYDSSEKLLVLGGFQEDDVDGCGNIRLGCIDLTSTPYEIDEQDDWGSGTYELTDGPLVFVDDGLYILFGNGIDEIPNPDVEAVAATFWEWDSGSFPFLQWEYDELYTNDDEFDGYKNVSVFAATYDYSSDPERVIMILNAVNEDSNDPYILVASIEVDPVNHTLGDMTMIAELEVELESGYTSAGGADFVFTDTSPVEGIGGGQTNSTSVKKFWIFRIEDS